MTIFRHMLHRGQAIHKTSKSLNGKKVQTYGRFASEVDDDSGADMEIGANGQKVALECCYCKQKFCSREKLKYHQGDYLYSARQCEFECAYCDYRCTPWSNMQKHELIHCGVKPYRCVYKPDECEATFMELESAWRHVLSRHLGRYYSICYTKYASFDEARPYVVMNEHELPVSGEKGELKTKLNELELPLATKAATTATKIRTIAERYQ